jgi:prenyltransferase beta subunit
LSFPEAAASRAGELVDWLRKCQNCDGGFGFFPGTTSYVEYCDYSLSALSLLNIRPADPVNAGQYICYCQTGAGGFSRSARAAPFLEASYHALQGLLCLRKFQGDFSTTLKGGSGREQFFRLISMCG